MSSSSSSPVPQVLIGKFVDTDPIAILKNALKTVRHHKLGWLQDDLLASGTLDGTKASLYARLFSDYQAQQIHIRAQKDILGADFTSCLAGMKREDLRSLRKWMCRRTTSV